jgi:hypothetical protein
MPKELYLLLQIPFEGIIHVLLVAGTGKNNYAPTHLPLTNIRPPAGSQ